MKVILLKTIPKLGNINEIKEVPNGYAYNFLIPQKLAMVATKRDLAMIETRKKKKARVNAAEKAEKHKLAKKLNKKRINFAFKADAKGTLYAGLNNKRIANELNKQGFRVNATEIKIKEPIKMIGEYKVKLKLGEEKIIAIFDIKAN